MKRLKTIFISCILFLVFSVPSFAFVPLLIPAWVYAPAAAIAITTAATGLYYGMNNGSLPHVDVSGNIKRAASVVYAHMVGGSAVLSTIAVDAKLTYAQLSALASAKPSDYPLLKSALSRVDSDPVPTESAINVGSIIYNQNTDSYLKITSSAHAGSYTQNRTTGVPPTPLLYIAPNGLSGYHWYINFSDATYTYWNQRSFKLEPAATPATVSATPSEFSSKIAVDGVSGSVKSDYAAEIDKALQDPSYVPAFSDTTTGFPWLPPSDILTPSELAAWNAAGAAQQAKEIAAAQAGEAAATAAAANNKAQSVAAAAEALAAASPEDAALAAAAIEARAAADASAAIAASASSAAASAAAAVAAADAADAATKASVASVIPVRPARSVISFEPLKALSGVLSTTYPFNLPTSITSYFSAFSGEGAAPVFDLPLPLGQTIHVDLSFFDPLATLIRYMIGILVSVGMLFYIVHFFRGIS